MLIYNVLNILIDNHIFFGMQHDSYIVLIQRFFGDNDNKAQSSMKYAKEDGTKEVLHQLDMDEYIKAVDVKDICGWLIQ